MFCKVYTAACIGIDGRVVQVEADLSNGLPSFRIVGEISGEVRESGARIRTAIRNSGYSLPPKRCVINLAPADFRKSGTGFDFPIAIALLCCIEQMNPEHLEKSIFVGELGLNGNLVPVKGILSMVSRALEAGFKACFVPEANVSEASILPGIDIYGVNSLREAVLHLQGKRLLQKRHSENPDKKGLKRDYPLDFKDIYGQEMAKRCMEISVAGHHHLLMIGPPGSGKTMMAERMPYILPDMEISEQIMVTKIHSAAGRMKPGKGLVQERPFRRPHHTISDKVMIGGGIVPIPGEISLAHGGILFLDEFAEFSRSTIESLRQPLESGEVFVHRVKGNCAFPAKPLIIAAMNPCKCGFFPDRQRCQCTPYQIQNYMSKISGPMIERMDLCVPIQRIPYDQMDKQTIRMSSGQMYERIVRAREIQKSRFLDVEIEYNSEMDPSMIQKHCFLDEETEAFFKKAYEKYQLSARTYQKILKVARTISDLEGEDQIRLHHVTEALCYRFPGESYGGESWD